MPRGIWMRGASTEERFWSNINKTETCWLWVPGTTNGGYGVFRMGRKTVRAHRFSYELRYGKIPNELHVCHHCDTPRCVNPDHLFLGTDADNMRDATAKGRIPSGERCYGAKLTREKVAEIRKRRLEGETQPSLAREFGVTQSQISWIEHNKGWIEKPTNR